MSAVTRLLKSFLGEPTTQPARRNPAPKFGMERLESREVPAAQLTAWLSGSTLCVEGTAGADHVYVRVHNESVRVHQGDNSSGALVPIAMPNGTLASSIPLSQLDASPTAYAVRLEGLGGDDWLTLQTDFPYRGRLIGGDGNDVLFSGLASDRLEAGDGNDYLYGRSGNDYLYGGDGNDRLYGEGGTDRLYGEGGADQVYGQGGSDRLDGGAGGDFLDGSEGDDTFYGGDGDDTLYGGDGDDDIWAGLGADIAYGGIGNDYLSGEDGDDTLRGDDGRDYLDGGGGSDNVQGNNGNDYVDGGSEDDVLDGGTGDDHLRGDGGDDVLVGGAGDDRLEGRAGNDALYGGTGNDTLNGEDGDDYLNGGIGVDYHDGGNGIDTYRRNLVGLPGDGFYATDPGSSESEPSDQPIDITGSALTQSAGSDSAFDVDQAATPTCILLAALAAEAERTGADDDLVSRLRYDSATDQYGVRLWVGGQWQTYWVNGDWTEGRDPGRDLWVTLYQKAYLQAMGVTSRGSNGACLPSEQWVSGNDDWQRGTVALSVVTGRTTTYVGNQAITPEAIRDQLAAGQTLVAGSNDTATSPTVIGDHGYAVREVQWDAPTGRWLVVLYNPWGRDGGTGTDSNTTDGLVTLDWATFAANFEGYTRA